MLMTHTPTHFVAEHITQSLIVLHNCLLVIQIWMDQNKLKLNHSKTEFVIIRNLCQRNKFAHIFPPERLNQKIDKIQYKKSECGI